jgi:hypothetical protein
MAEFYCIKLIRNSDGVRGWLIDSPRGVEISVGGATTDITMFTTEQDALKFIREHKVERGGIKAYVRTNQEMIQEYKDSGDKGMSAVPKDKPLYHLENHIGEKLFYDSKTETYCFKKVDAGYPVWDNEEEIRSSVKKADLQQPMIFMVKHTGKAGEYEKTPIQAYGRKKNPDGTMGELEYIELKAGDVTGNPFDDTVN